MHDPSQVNPTRKGIRKHAIYHMQLSGLRASPTAEMKALPGRVEVELHQPVLLRQRAAFQRQCCVLRRLDLPIVPVIHHRANETGILQQIEGTVVLMNSKQIGEETRCHVP